ncbi:MAG: glycosyltransferase family 4 protein [Acidimicrobiia bacterium]|nr:glycosyltransferase family 4 protein [Acidimicrobiia bacterium]
MVNQPFRVLFVNENIGGHATMHHHIRLCLADHPDVAASFYDVPAPGIGRRLVGTAVPGLSALDADLQPLRSQLALSAMVRRELHRRRRRGSYDVVHIYTHNAGLCSVADLAATASVVGLDATNAQSYSLLPSRHPGPFTPHAVRLAQLFEQRVYDAATLVLTKSAWAAASLRRDYDVGDDRLRILPLGVSVPAAGRTALGPGDEKRVTFIGRSMDRKGGWRLLDLWRRELRSLCRLTLVTPERVPPQLGLEVVSDIRVGDGRLPELLRRTAVLVCPSEIDTFGYAAMEAMAIGVPVVADDAGAFGEIIDDGRSGFVVPPGDDRALSDGVRRLVTDDELNRRMGRAARRRMAEHYDARVTTAALVGILHEAFERDGPRRDHHAR